MAWFTDKPAGFATAAQLLGRKDAPTTYGELVTDPLPYP